MGRDTDRNMPNNSLKEQKREILERGLRSMLQESSIPLQMHLKMVQSLRIEVERYRSELEDHKKSRSTSETLSKEILKGFSTAQKRIDTAIARMDREIARLTSIKHLKGEPGKDAVVDVGEIIELLKPFMPAPLPAAAGEPGKDGADAQIDIDELSKEIVDKIRKEKLIEITDIRNAQSFIFNNKRYKFEELMRGAGGSNTGGGVSPLTEQVTATQSGDNALINLSQLSSPYSYVLFVTRNGQVIMPNGNALLPGSSWSQSGDIITVYNADAENDVFLVQYVPTA